MQETADQIEQLQAILTRSIERAGPFLRESFQMPGHSFSAAQLCAYFSGSRTVALATASRDGAPRVAPTGCFLLQGVFYIPTVRAAARARMVARRPQVSMTAFDGIDVAVIVHGRATLIGEDDGGFARLDALQQELGNSSVRRWGAPGDGCFLAVAPETIVTFRRFVEA